MENKPNILLCVSGFTPAIITETLWCLTQGYNSENERFRIDEIHVITTTDGKAKLDEYLFDNGKFAEFKQKYPDCSHIKFSDRFVHLLTNEPNKKPDILDSEEIQLKDVKTGEENECAANQIYLILKDLVKKSSRIHASAAGGRKTMSIYLTVMMQLLARAEDTLSHVVVWDEWEPFKSPDFLYPNPELLKSDKPLPISLAFIPFIRLREAGKKIIEDLMKDEHSYSKAVEKVHRSLKLGESNEKLILNTNKFTVRIRDTETKISGIRMVLLLLYKSFGKSNAISDDSLRFENFDNAFYQLNGKFRFADITRDLVAEGVVTGEVFKTYKSLKEIDKLFKRKDVEAMEEFLQKMREWRNRINNEVLKKKLNLTEKYFILNRGEYGEAKYGFEIDVETEII